MYRKFIPLLLLLALLSACSGTNETTPATMEIVLNANEFSFFPATLEVKAGQPVKLIFQNTDVLEHDFSIVEIPLAGEAEATGDDHGHGHDASDAPKLHVVAAPGETGTLEFTPTEPGEYEFDCTVAGHKEAGMVGKLIVK